MLGVPLGMLDMVVCMQTARDKIGSNDTIDEPPTP